MIGELLIFIIIVLAFSILAFGLKFIRNRIKNSKNRFFNLKEYLPEEELQNLTQIFYLMMMLSCFVFIFYAFIYYDDDLFLFAFLEVVLCIYLASKLEDISIKNVVIFLLLVPFGSFDFIITGGSLIGVFDLIHIFVFVYYIKVYFNKFMEYTESNGLGITIMLLFVLITISFFLTQFTEGVNALDAITMVSNAFTSNGYAVLGHSALGKINSVFLVWGGYVLSGVGTATLTAAILLKYFNKRFDELEEMIKKNNDD